MKSRAIVASLCFGAALLFCSNAQAGFGLFGGHRGCCEPTCGFEPSCGVVDDCCDPCGSARRCCVLDRVRGLFNRHNGGCCEPTCCAPEPSCCAPEPSCCAVEPSCGCNDNCCAPRCRIIEKIGGLFRRSHNGCGCCEPSCGFEPSCGCNG